jgi:hypothetical protein
MEESNSIVSVLSPKNLSPDWHLSSAVRANLGVTYFATDYIGNTHPWKLPFFFLNLGQVGNGLAKVGGYRALASAINAMTTGTVLNVKLPTFRSGIRLR